MRWHLALCVLLVASSAVTPATGATPNEPPLADAGLDQTVAQGATVLLDGSGSRDPDGEITSFEWTITAPDGTDVAPSCRACARTTFRAVQTGRYAATLTVTDHEGATASDTLYVTVESGAGPTVSLRGPDRTTTAASPTFRASVTAGGAPLANVTWYVDGSRVHQDSIAGPNAVANLTHGFSPPGTYTIAVEVRDAAGHLARASKSVQVRRSGSNRTGSTGGSTPLGLTIDGPTIVTGTEPLEATYRVTSSDPSRIAAVEWVIDGRRTGAGTLYHTWAPGRHTLVARVTLENGSVLTATFPDGSRTVVADPAPEVGFDRIAAGREINGTAVATDEHGRITDVYVYLDGRRITAWHGGRGRQVRTGGDERQLPFAQRGVHLGATYTLRVVAVDDRGQRSETTTTVTPTAETNVYEPLSPTVEGPTLVTGERPLQATYSISTADRSRIQRVTWLVDGDRVGTGFTLERAWEPGHHTIVARVTTTNGSTMVAEFGDDTRQVIADPKPSATISNLTAGETLSGTILASDGFGTLQSVEVRVDGVEVATWPGGPARNPFTEVSAKELTIMDSTVDPGTLSSVVVTVVDDRGQETVVRRDVMPMTQPEVIRSGFQNSPVDSYHPRIDPERYTAVHVVVVELNGADPNSVQVKRKTRNGSRILNSHREYDSNNGILIFTTELAAPGPGVWDYRYKIKSLDPEFKFQKNDYLDVLEVTASPPEIRLEIIDYGTRDQRKNWGLVVDAGGSFDPDGSKLSYQWLEGAEAVKNYDYIAKFDSWSEASLVVQDQQDQKAKKTHAFLDYANPGIASVEVLSTGPYMPNDTVRVKVVTNEWKLPKQSHYTVDLGLGITGGDGRVVSWKKIEDDAPQEVTSRNHAVGVIEIQARQLTDSTTQISLYNLNNPEITEQSVDFPDVRVYQYRRTEYRHIEVSNIRYEEIIRDFVEETADTHAEKRRLQSKGYRVVRRIVTDRTYHLQKYVKIQSAEYETRRKEFRSRYRRQFYIDSHRGWRKAGTTTERVRRTKSRYVWRDGRDGSGVFTGRTRRIKVSGPRYRTIHQYEHVEYVEKTRTKKEWRTKTKTVWKTRKVTKERCGMFGCRLVTVTEKYRTTKEVRVRVTVTETYKDRKRTTYWASRPRSPDDSPTGRTKRVKTAPARYETQYQFELTETVKERVTRYLATTQVQVQERRFGWVEWQSTTDRRFAKTMSGHPDVRITRVEKSYGWLMEKAGGTYRVTTPSYRNESNVVKTIAEVQGFVAKVYEIPETGEQMIVTEGNMKASFQADVAYSSEEIIYWIRTFGTENGCENSIGPESECEGN